MHWRRNCLVGQEILKEQGRGYSCEAQQPDGARYQEGCIDHCPLHRLGGCRADRILYSLLHKVKSETTINESSGRSHTIASTGSVKANTDLGRAVSAADITMDV